MNRLSRDECGRGDGGFVNGYVGNCKRGFFRATTGSLAEVPDGNKHSRTSSAEGFLGEMEKH